MRRIAPWFVMSLLCFLSLPQPGRANTDLVSLYKNTELTVLDISERSYDGGNALAITLAVPLDPAKDHSGYLNVSEKKGGKVDGAWVLSESGKTLYFPYATPSHEYLVTVYKGLTAINHSRLKTTQSKPIKTRAMSPVVNFGSQGMILPSVGSKGLPVISVNVDEVDIDFHYVEESNIPEFLANWYSGQSKRLYELESLTQKSELAYSGRFSLNPPANKRRTINLPIHTIKPLQNPGMYMAVMRQAGTYPYSFQATYYMVSDLGLHVRSYEKQLDVYVNSIQNAEGVGNIQLVMLDKKGVILQETITTPEGVGTFAAPYDKAKVILAKQGKQVSLLNLTTPALDLSEFSLGDRPQKKIETFFYGPRDIYRPGEMVDINMLVRSGDGDLLAPFPIPAKIKRPDGQVLKEFLWKSKGDLGYYHYGFKLPRTAQTGEWKLWVTPTGKAQQSYSFKVEEFLPERMSLTYEDSHLKNRFVDKTSPINIPLTGMYLYGAPAAGNRMSAAVSYKQNRTPLSQFKGFEFGDADDQPTWSRYDLDDIVLDSEGKGVFSLDSKWQKTNSPLTVRLTGSLFESGGRPVSRSISYTVWPHDNLIGVRPLFSENELENNSLAAFELVMVGKNGQRLVGKEVEVKLIREDRDYFWFFDDNRGWRSRYNEKAYTAFSKIITIKDHGKNKIEFPVENGHYRIEVHDPKTGALTSSRFHAGYSWWWYNNKSGNAATRPDVVSLILDKKQYKAGDVAKLTIVPPHAGKGFIVVESDAPLWFRPIAVDKKGTTIDIPVDKDWDSHNIYISAMVLRPQDGKVKRTINRAMGLTHLKLNRSERNLAVSVEAPEKMWPETTQPFTFTITGQDQKTPPSEVMLTVAAVDVGVLNITDFKTPDPLSWFFDQRRYGIDSHDIYGKVIESFEGELAGIRFGGDEDLSRGGKQPMTDVQIISLFTGPVKVGRDGKAVVDIEIPDFNGRLRIMALAFSANRFGSNDAETTVAAPIVAEISLPRFLAPGDESQAVVDVRNMTRDKQKLSLKLNTTRPLSLSDANSTTTLKPGEKDIQIIPISVKGYKPQSTINLSLNNGDTTGEEIKLTRQWKLGIRPAYPAFTKRINATLHKGESLNLDTAILDNLIPDTVQTSIMVSSSPRLELPHHLKKLLHYPYGCLEQTISSAFPFVLVDDGILGQLQIKDWTQEKRQEAIAEGLQRIAAIQRPNGSFGLWSNTSPEEQYLTVYASHFMLLAKAKGYIVSEKMMDHAMRRLKYYLRNSNSMTQRYTQDKAHYTMAYRSYAGYVLAQTKRANLSNLRNIYDNHQQDAKSGLPLVHLGLALKEMGDHKRGDKAINQGLARRRGDVYLGDYGSTFRDTALIIGLLQQHQIQTDKADELLFDLADQLHNKRYLSTQDRTGLLQAGIPYMSHKRTPWQGTLHANGERLRINDGKDYHSLLNHGQINDELSFTSDTTSPLYATILVSGYPASPMAPVANQVDVERTYYDLEGEERDITELVTGDLVLVGLEVSAKERLADLLVVDLLPAGLELENPNLIHAMGMADMKIGGVPVPELMERTGIKHQEFKDDRFVAAIDQSNYRPSYLFYLARAVTPGSYNVPPPLVEDMYRPAIRAVGETPPRMVVKAK